jgi:hypothetical protein
LDGDIGAQLPKPLVDVVLLHNQSCGDAIEADLDERYSIAIPRQTTPIFPSSLQLRMKPSSPRSSSDILLNTRRQP